MRTAVKMTTVLRGTSVSSSPTNSVPAAISADAVIGTEITVTPGTWTLEPTLTYQWQRNTGSWVDIDGATDDAYTPVDADFGYALRVLEIPNGNAGAAVASNTTDTTEAVRQIALGAQLVTNPGDPFTFSGDNPTGWTVSGESGSNPMVTEVGAGGGAGTGYLRLYSTANLIRISQSILSIGSEYEYVLDINAIAAGNLNVRFGSTVIGYSAAGIKRSISRATGTTLLAIDSFNIDVVLKSAGVKLLTPAAMLTAPSADGELVFLYTLPASPAAGELLSLHFRASSEVDGNYRRVLLQRNAGNTNWDIALQRLASHAATNETSASNIGTTNGIKIVMSGNDMEMFTTADGGENWTKRGSTVSNSTYAAETGVNVRYVSTVTPGRLSFTGTA